MTTALRHLRRRATRWAPTIALLATTTLSASACSYGAGQVAPTSGAAGSPAHRATGIARTGGGTPIRIVIGDTVLDATLGDNAPARDLVSRLPLTLRFSDLGGQEKVGHLDHPLSTEGMPAGDNPVPRDIGYYAPWGNLVFYYGDIGYWDGIERIGQFTGAVAAIRNQRGDFTAIVELAR